MRAAPSPIVSSSQEQPTYKHHTVVFRFDRVISCYPPPPWSGSCNLGSRAPCSAPMSLPSGICCGRSRRSPVDCSRHLSCPVGCDRLQTAAAAAVLHTAQHAAATSHAAGKHNSGALPQANTTEERHHTDRQANKQQRAAAVREQLSAAGRPGDWG